MTEAAAITLQRSDAPAVIADGAGVLSYRDLNDRVDAFVAGMPRHCVVMALVNGSLDALVGVIACLSRNLVLLPVGARLDDERTRRLIEAYRPDFLWRPSDGGYVLEDLRSARGDRPNPNPELALLLSTSGSTGEPKMVRLSRENVRANSANIADCLKMTAADRYVSTLPLDHTYGISMVTAVLQAGAAILSTEKSMMERGFWEFFAESRASVMGGVPYTYEMLGRLGFTRRRLPFLRVLSVAGGGLSDELQRHFADYAAREAKSLVLMYGQTEATALMAALASEHVGKKIGSIGLGCGGVLRLVDECGVRISEPGKVGELVFEGRGVSLGYAESGADLPKGDERGGRLRSGDLAKLDEDGFLYVVGRLRRFLKLQGNRVNLDDVEALVRKAYPFVDCACVGTDSRMRIFVSADVDADSVAAKVRLFVAERTSLSPSLFEAVPIETIPRTATGKIAYSELP